MTPDASAGSYRVCVVCTGNICRSPMGEVVLRHKLEEAGLGDRVEVDSAGIGDYHVGDGADPRTVQALADSGYDGSAHRAAQWEATWVDERDLVLVADEGHLNSVRRLAHGDTSHVRLLREFDPDAVEAGTLEVDDPYYGGDDGFARVLAEIEAACDGVVAHLTDRLD